MTLIFNQSDWDDLNQQAPATCPEGLVLEEFEELTGIPEWLGRGYGREMELLPGVGLGFMDVEFHQDCGLKQPDHPHLIQITVFLAGLMDCDIHPTFGTDHSYFSGSGISPGYVERQRGRERLTFINLEIEPKVMESVFLDARQRESDGIRQLFKGEEWKVSFYPKVTPALRSLVQQMWTAPYRGAAKRLYLQGKVFELLAMHLDLIAENQQTQISVALKSDRINRLHHAKDILTRQFAQPPALPELAAQVGLSPRSLQRGFQRVFNTTISGYLKQCRLEQAEQLLRQGNQTVAEVALQVGYGHLGHFAIAFKQQFGITPSQCLAGKRVIQLD